MTAADAMAALEQVRARLEGLHLQAIEQRMDAGARVAQLEQEIGAIDRALDALRRDKR